MEDSDDRNIKAKIDEITKKVRTIIKNIPELKPVKKEDSDQNQGEPDTVNKEDSIQTRK